MKPARYILSPAAIDDLRGITSYYLSNAGREVAARIVGGIHTTCQLLADTPGRIGHGRDELLPEVRSIPVRPHVIYFRYAGNVIEVIRVLHERQDVEAEFGE